MADVDALGDQRREQAIMRLRKRSEFWMHLTAFGLINGALIVIWLVTGAG